jgi:LmbE family N-acetylglucosaminyl deacetylase
MQTAVASEHLDSRLAADRPARHAQARSPRACSPRAWSPEEGPLLVVAPHPDDEILGAGGLIRTWTMRGAEVSVLSVSDGAADAPDRPGRGAVRLTQALRRLCPTHVSVTRLGIRDGTISCHLNRLRNALLSLARGKLTLIAPYERDRHPDRAAVGDVCLKFARDLKLPIARYAIRAWPRAAADGSREPLLRKFPLTDDARRAKARALGCFRAQFDGAGVGPLAEPYEAFIL